MKDALAALWNSTEALHKRFNVYPPDGKEILRVFTEEYYEVVESTLTSTEKELANEGADLIVTLIGVLMSRGISIDELEQAMHTVAAKNDSKTHETHYINGAGKIARRTS